MKPSLNVYSGSFLPSSTACIFFFMFISCGLSAQSLVDFSGKWEFDKSQSSPGKVDSNYDGIVIRDIRQNAETFIYADIYKRAGSNDWSTSDEIFNLNGQEQTEKRDAETYTKQASWSADGKTLTLVYKVNYEEDGVPRELIVSEMYKISDDGKILYLEEYSKNHVTGEKTAHYVYNRLQE